MKITVRINDLIEAHKNGYGKCNGCKMCDEIAKLKELLLQGYRNVTLVKKGDEEMKLSKEQLVKHLQEGLKVKEIAGMYDMGISTVHRLKSEWGLTKKQTVSSAEKLEVVKQEVKQVIAEDPSKIQELETLIARLEEEASDFKIREVFLNNNLAEQLAENKDLKKQLDKLQGENSNLKAAADDTENEAYAAAQTIQQLKSENIDLLAELAKEREKYKAYKDDNELVNETNQELRELLNKANRTVSVFRNALKEVL